MARLKFTTTKVSAAHPGFETKRCLTADHLRSHTNSAKCNPVVLGLLSSRCILDTFGTRHATLAAGEGSYAGTHPEDKVERRVDILRRSPGSACNGSSSVPTPAPTTVPLGRWSFIR